jgi:hypothetical protein
MFMIYRAKASREGFPNVIDIFICSENKTLILDPSVSYQCYEIPPNPIQEEPQSHFIKGSYIWDESLICTSIDLSPLILSWIASVESYRCALPL